MASPFIPQIPPDLFTIKEGDDGPPMRVQLTDSAGQLEQQAQSVAVHLRNEDGDVIQLTGTAVHNNTTGETVYNWAEDETLPPPDGLLGEGIYFAEVEVIRVDGEKRTYPNGNDLKVRVTRQIA